MSITAHGLRTAIYPAPDLAAAKAWWSATLGVEPYFDEPFYVGFNVGGYELGLMPDAAPADGVLVYWAVDDVPAALEAVVAQGGTEHTPPSDVDDGIVVGSARTPDGSVLGLIYNPNFSA
jgi:predicted enzyme related to lactoylglutathione lyase